MTVVNMPEQATWYTMNMLKRSIEFMKKRNIEGKFDIAIGKEEAILRSFFDVALGRSEAEAQQVAA
jgi:hypothetical protein